VFGSISLCPNESVLSQSTAIASRVHAYSANRGFVALRPGALRDTKALRRVTQVSDYAESLPDPLNLKAIEKALGYVPKSSLRAVLIGRTPPVEDANLWEKRKAEQPSVRIITYDEVLQEHRERLARRRGG